DHAVVRMGLKYVLEMDEGFKVVGELSDGADAIKLIREKKPDVLLLDIYMPGKNGLSVLEDILIAFPEQKVIMLTTSAADNDAYTALELGAKGYLLKDRDAKELPKAIREVAEGGRYVPAEIRDLVKQRLMNPGPTLREQAVLECMVKGLGNEEIGEELGISKNCVKIHVKHLYQKLGVNDRVAAVGAAIRRGFIHLAVLLLACASHGAGEIHTLTRLMDSCGVVTGEVSDVRANGLVSHVSALKPGLFIVTFPDRPYKGGVPVVLNGSEPIPCEGDEINFGGTAVYRGKHVSVKADGYVKTGESAPSYGRAKSVDLRNGLLDYRTVKCEGTVVKVIHDSEGGIEKTILRTSIGKPYVNICVPGFLEDRLYLGRRIKAEGCVFPLFDSTGRARAHEIEVSSRDSVTILDPPAEPLIPDWAYWFAGAALTLAFLASLVAWIRARRRRIALEAVTAERKRMAADLHDTIEQHLACVNLLLGGALNNDRLPERAVKTLARATEVLANAKLEVRDAVLNLRSDEAQTKSPETALRDMARDVSKGGTVKTRVMLRGLPNRLRQGAYQDLMLIAREAVTNAIKHGKAGTVAIVGDPREDGGFVLKVLNDGEKFDAESALGPETGHFGLSGMRERAARNGFGIRMGTFGDWCGVVLEVPATKGKES
ncbi:MAG: response regulator, partial [Kiritimatiellae bacterium]|nr:response regulator [Kiritimatiellia bacterium]